MMMKTFIRNILVLVLLSLTVASSYAQQQTQDIYFNSSGGSITLYPNSTSNYSSVPDWITVSYVGTAVTLTCAASSTSRSESYVVGYPPGGSFITGCIRQGDASLACGSGGGTTTPTTPTTPTTEPTTCDGIWSISLDSEIDIGYGGISGEFYTFNTSPSICTGRYTIRIDDSAYSWVNITSVTGSSFYLSCDPLEKPEDRSATIYFKVVTTDYPDGTIKGAIRINQDKGCSKYWYPDSDNDGFGDKYANSVIACSEPSTTQHPNWVDNNDDQCSEFYSTVNNGCKVGEPTDDMNYVYSESFDINGKLISEGISYFDELGKGIQSQTWDPKTNKVWTTETLYDDQGRPALSTSSAPTGNSIVYKEGFIENASGNVFNKTDLGDILDDNLSNDDPSEVGNAEGTLGYYYSEANTDPNTNDETGNHLNDVTTRPYSRTFYDELNPGKTLKTVGGNKVDTNGDGTPDSYPQGFSYTMSAAQELYYAFGKDNLPIYKYFDFQLDMDVLYVNPNITKTVTIDVHGEEVVSFAYADGQVLARARSGEGPQKQVTSLIGEQGFVDIHLPKGCESSIIFSGGFANYKVYNLKTGKLVENESDITAGIYRIEAIYGSNSHGLTYINNNGQIHSTLTYVDNNGNIKTKISNNRYVTYNINYYDYSLNYYDDAGNLTSSLQPLGFDNDAYANYNLTGEVTHINEALKSHFKYNTLGQLLEASSPDEGTAWFKYRTDGQIRFSQNSKQALAGEFSYTNYDNKARPVESGVAKGTFSSLDPDSEAFSFTDKSEQNFTVYDYLIGDELDSLITYIDEDEQRTNGNDYLNPAFLAGNVAATHNDNGSTYYSYDIYGRVTWIVQKINGLDGVKTIDYEYDDVTGAVNKVYYQKGVANEQFIHKYTYDEDDYSLVRVETSTDDSIFTIHADYEYYETGGLKRTVLAEGLQGIDYVYNLNGALKAINHPSLDPTKDPGGDANDVFGMMIDYYKGDYNRSGVHMNTSDYGQNQYNGNIKAVRWNNKATDAYTEDEKAYVYTYNRNNWLTQADFVQGEGAAITPSDLVFDENQPISTPLTASNSIIVEPETTLRPGAVLSIGQIETSSDDYQVSNITYDANGNIKTLKRNKNTLDGNNGMDNMIYHYDPNKPNQLNRVEDLVTEETNAEDIKSQSTNNYEYNEIGQLEYNNAEGIEYIYTTSGLVSEIKKDNTTLLKFFYNDRGQRVKKESYNPTTGALSYTDVYVRDAAGTPMAIYRDEQVVEHTVYGASRLGVYKRNDNSTAYELTDHLGNVRAVIKKETESYTGTDYYPGGMAMPLRNSLSDYRYQYQGQELDPETGKPAFELRLYDPRIMRWLTTDPYGQFDSPYVAMGNNPVSFIDPDGGYCQDAQGNNIPCPDGYGAFNGPTEDTATFMMNDLGQYEYTGIGLSEIVINSNNLGLNEAGFSTRANITVDHIPALEYGRPVMGTVESIILHRTVSSNYPGGWMKSKKKIKGAHFYVDKDGTAYQTASLNKSVAHLYVNSKQMYAPFYGSMNNSNAVGIEVVGNYKNNQWEPLTAQQIEATTILVRQIKNQYNIHNANIHPHEEVQRKTAGEGQTVMDAISLD